MDRAKFESVRLSQVIAIEAQHFIEGTRQLLFALAQYPPLQKGDTVSCNLLFAKLLKEYPHFTNIGAVAVPEGTVFASGLPAKVSVNASDRAWFKRALETRDFSVGDYQVSRITGRPGVNFSYPVLDDDGKIRAVIFAALDLTWFHRLVAKVPLGNSIVLTVVDNNGTILVRHPEPEKWVGKPMPEARTVQSLLDKGESSAEISLDDGSTSLYAFSRLPFKGSSAFVSIAVQKEVAFAPVNRVFFGSLLILGAVAVVALAGGWYVGEVLILQRVQSLGEVTKRLALGDLNARSGLPYDKGEIGELAQAFDEMAEAISQREKEMKLLSRENEIIARLGQIISSTLNIEEVYERFVDEVHVLMPFNRIAINLVNWEERTVTIAYVSGVDVPGRRRGDTIPLSGSATWEILRTRKGFIFQEGMDDEEILSRIPGLVPARKAGLRSMIMVPLISKGEPIGALYMLSREADAYSEKDLRLLESIANQIAGAIANAQLFGQHERAERELEKAHRALRVICDSNQLIIRAPDEITLLQEVCRIITEVGGYRMAWIGYAEYDEQKTVRPMAWSGYEHGYIEAAKITWAETERGLGAMGRAIRTGTPSIVKNMMTDPNYEPWRAEAARRGYASSIVVPLRSEGRILGAIAIYASEPDAFDEEESRLLTELGNDLSYGIEMLRMQAKKQEAEKALLESAQQWRITFDAIYDAVCLMDVEGKIIRCNAAMAKFLGKPFEQITGCFCYQLVHDKKEHIQRCPQVRMRETLQREQEILAVGDRWIRIIIDPILDENGSLTGSVHIMSDITEQKQAEMKMASLEEQMRQAQKMEAIGRLAGGVAHDFNNLLTVIKGNSQLALLMLENGNPLKEGIKEIEKASDKAANLVRQLLAFSRRQIMETRVIDLNILLG
ncbi:MAG: GAF domain-containing protein, partial [candidate division WOR-3 bacterium]